MLVPLGQSEPSRNCCPGFIKRSWFHQTQWWCQWLVKFRACVGLRKKENKISQESLKSGNTKSIAAFIFSPCALSPIHIWVPPIHTWACDYACFGHVMDTVMIMYV